MTINNKRTLIQLLNTEQISNSFKVENIKINLLFDFQVQINCEPIFFHNSVVSIQNLNMIGSLSFYNCSVVIIDSQITQNQKDTNPVLLADSKTILIVFNTTMNSKESITIQNESFGSFTNCKIINFMKGVLIQGQSKSFFLNSQFKNTQDIDQSKCIGISNSSHVQIIGCSFEKCNSEVITISTNSFLNFSKSTISNASTHIVFIKEKSEILAQHCIFTDVSTNSELFVIDNSHGTINDCNFINIHYNPIYAQNNSQLSVKRCLFNGDKRNNSRIYISQSFGTISCCQIQNCTYGIYVGSSGKFHIHDLQVEKVREAIRANNTSKRVLVKCNFNQISKVTIQSYASSTIQLKGCSLIDAGKTCLKSESKGMIKLFYSRIQQSNQPIPVFKIGKEGLIIEESSIEWDNEINYQKEFAEAEKVHIHKVILNQIYLKNFEKP
jgi:hypothetical protein